MDTFLQDLRYALRGLARSPAFTVAAVLTLALGIGANTAIFSVVNGVVLKPLPYAEPEALVSVMESNLGKGFRAFSVSPANYLDLRDQSSDLVASLTAYESGPAALASPAGAERVRLLAATPDLFETLGVAPALGRPYGADEAVPGRSHVVLLSHALFESRFGGDRSLLGRPISVDGVPYEVIGVLPAGFAFPLEGSDLFIPLQLPKDVEGQRGAHYLSVVGRLRPGATVRSLRQKMESVGQSLSAAHPRTNKGWGVSVEGLQDRIVGPVRPALLVLLAAVGLVTLIACVNVASLLLARAAAREGDLAMRIALGASRSRLLRQLLTEALVIAVAGGALAVLLAVWGLSALARFGPGDVPRLATVALDGRVLLFTGALVVVTSIAFGLVPALRASRPELTESIQDRARGTGRHESPLRAALVVGEIALTLTLLVGAGLLLRSFRSLIHVDAGIRTERVLTFSLSLPESRYGDDAALAAFYGQLHQRLDALPGVASSGAIFGLPLSGHGFSSSFSVEGAPVPPEDQPSGQLRIVSGRYFETLGIALRAGRGFTGADRRGAAHVVLASERAARLFWPKGDALGKRLKFGASPGPDALGGEIVGIVADVRDRGLDVDATPLFYLPEEQSPASDLSVVVKASVPPLTLATAVRREVAALDPELPVADLGTLDDVLQRSVARPRFYALLLGSFAGVALLLSAVGLYGVISYGVTRRTREFGVRVALGAQRLDVLALVLRQGARLTGAGLALGLVVSLFATRLLSTLLFGVSPTDGPSFAVVGLLLALVAFLACFLPALRATRVDPIAALRNE